MTNECMNGQIDAYMDSYGRIDICDANITIVENVLNNLAVGAECIDGWMDGWMDGWTDGRMVD